MSPRMEADFDGGWEGVQAAIPVHPKGEYELTIKAVRAAAWPQKNGKTGEPTGEVTQVIALRPEVVGYYDSKGKLQDVGPDGKEVKGASCEEIQGWVRSIGGRKVMKKYMMAICGYNPEDEEEEKAFNSMLKASGLDLHIRLEEKEDEEGFKLDIGEGYEKLLVGKNVRATMEPETRPVEGRDPVTQQKFNRLSPVNATAAPVKSAAKKSA